MKIARAIRNLPYLNISYIDGIGISRYRYKAMKSSLALLFKDISVMEYHGYSMHPETSEVYKKTIKNA